MKLEVGMYVRTNEGIGTVQRIYNNKNDCTVRFKKGHVKKWVTIFKASHNIIDLIEENDYIRIVTSAYFEPVYYSYGKLVIRDDIDISKYTNKFIAEVITHEQIKSMSYKVGE